MVGQTPAIAFTAFDATSRTLNSGDVIDFPYVISNVGNAYDPVSDVFTCPYDGVYAFHVHILSATDDICNAAIVLNGDTMTSAFADNVASTSQQASNAAYVECEAGGRVWVEATTTGSTYSNTNRYVTFSGHFVGFTNSTQDDYV